ncbi:hypothetical protein, partial [Halalkalibacter oceani]|uniref:hypothetical protein n=1 Tax=Halalkalibacter oceani TaxID=1653776 RepID=UPI003391C49C
VVFSSFRKRAKLAEKPGFGILSDFVPPGEAAYGFKGRKSGFLFLPQASEAGGKCCKIALFKRCETAKKAVYVFLTGV